MKRILAEAIQVIRSIKHRKFDNFVFIHINKTAGSSIEKALNLPFEHKTALEKIEEIGRKRWDEKLTFTIVRNPWDKVVSHYHYRVKTNQTNLRVNPIGFKEWVKLTYGYQDAYYYNNPKMFMPQTLWISDENDEIIVDEIVHFENLESEFNKVLKRIGKNAPLTHVKKSKRGNYREYYDSDSIEIIRNWFKRDIEIFGYEF